MSPDDRSCAVISGDGRRQVTTEAKTQEEPERQGVLADLDSQATTSFYASRC
jgi:hypothetical protein